MTDGQSNYDCLKFEDTPPALDTEQHPPLIMSCCAKPPPPPPTLEQKAETVLNNTEKILEDAEQTVVNDEKAVCAWCEKQRLGCINDYNLLTKWCVSEVDTIEKAQKSGTLMSEVGREETICCEWCKEEYEVIKKDVVKEIKVVEEEIEELENDLWWIECIGGCLIKWAPCIWSCYQDYLKAQKEAKKVKDTARKSVIAARKSVAAVV